MRLAPPPLVTSGLTRGVAAAAVAVLATGLLAAAPASAAVTPAGGIRVANCGASPASIGSHPNFDPVPSITWDAAGTLTVYNVCNQGVSAASLNIDVKVYAGSTAIAGAEVLNISYTGAGTGSLPLPADTTATAINIYGAGTSSLLATIPASYTPASSGGSGSASGSTAPIPASLTLSVGTDSGAVCKEGSAVSGYVGEWLTLPKQGDCTFPSKPNAVLLGWSTSQAFPVAIAQRQADHDWGAYEVKNAEGIVTDIFVPAGHETFVSGANTLYPIFSA